LTIIMTFCVSHQKQLDNDSNVDSIVANKLVIDSDINDETRLSHSNGTENTNLGKSRT
jgi:hypothetical protein